MTFDERIEAINILAQKWLDVNEKDEAKPKELMVYLIKHGVYGKDVKMGKPLRDDLRKLYRSNELGRINGLVAEPRNKNISWFIKKVN